MAKKPQTPWQAHYKTSKHPRAQKYAYFHSYFNEIKLKYKKKGKKSILK